MVDERSAGYFALGLSQQLHVPVVLSCTSSTATCNYWPPVAEAFYQGVPLLVLTSDRDQHNWGSGKTKMIDQVGMYDRHVRKSVNLPIVNNNNDFHFCQRLVNEGSYENVTVEGFDKQFNINYRGTYFLSKAFLEMKTKESNVKEPNCWSFLPRLQTCAMIYHME